MAIYPSDLPVRYQEQIWGKLQEEKAKSKSKYGNVKTEVDGLKFDSKKEADRFVTLRQWEKSGTISDLRLQVEFLLIPSYTKSDGERVRAVKYYADFVYKAPYGDTVIEDVKGRRTKEYIIKKKMMANLGHTITEI